MDKSKEKDLWQILFEIARGNWAVTQKLFESVKREANRLSKEEQALPNAVTVGLKNYLRSVVVGHSLDSFAQLCILDRIDMPAEEALKLFLKKESIPIKSKEKLLRLQDSNLFEKLLHLSMESAERYICWFGKQEGEGKKTLKRKLDAIDEKRTECYQLFRTEAWKEVAR